MSLLEEGQVVRDTYTVERKLGEGFFAEVYRVRHRFLGRQAMKVFKTIGLSAADLEQMFGEALLLSRLSHPNIIRVFDANVTMTERGTLGYFTMELVAGGSLLDYWRSYPQQPMPVPLVVDLVQQACSGLALAHGEAPPVLHRDIKPDNILVGQESNGLRVRLSDFGLAKKANALTHMASARGAIGFKAPECLRGMGSDSAASDVWSVGYTLYLLLTNSPPYPEPDRDDTLRQRRFDQLVPASTLNIRVDPALDAIVNRALALNPRDRYPSAVPMLADLQRWQPQADERVPPVPAVPQPQNEDEARQMVAEAMGLAKQAGRLTDAARMLEAACDQSPALREEYEDQLSLWRRGIAQ